MLRSNHLSALMLLAAGVQSFFKDTEEKREGFFVQPERERTAAISKAADKQARKNAKRKTTWTGNT